MVLELTQQWAANILAELNARSRNGHWTG